MTDRTPSHGTDSGRTLVQPWRIGVLFLLLWGVLVAWQVAEHLADIRRQNELLEQTGRRGIGMLEVGFKSAGCVQRDDPSFLKGVLEQMATIPGSLGVWITERSGQILAENGKPIDLPPAEIGPVSLWRDEGLLLVQGIDLGACPFDGCGKRRESGFAQRGLFVYLLLDRADVDASVARSLQMRLAIVVAASIVLGFLFLLMRARARQVELNMELAMAEERALRHREWALAGAGLAHETKNPLSLVRGHAQRLLQNGEQRADRESAAQQIVDETDRVVARINEFLSLSRPIHPRLEDIPVQPLLREMAALIEPDLSTKGVRIEIGEEASSIKADPEMIRQVLLNLLINAISSSEPGGRILLGAERTQPNGIALEVRDEGRGMPGEELERIFEPYYSRSPGGTGLGLAIVRRLVEVHGWKIEVESRPGGGARFRILGIERGADER